jgi:hypothetical protein
MQAKMQSKLAELAKTKEQILAQLNAIIGAEQVLRELLEAKEGGGDDQPDA